MKSFGKVVLFRNVAASPNTATTTSRCAKYHQRTSVQTFSDMVDRFRSTNGTRWDYPKTYNPWEVKPFLGDEWVTVTPEGQSITYDTKKEAVRARKKSVKMGEIGRNGYIDHPYIVIRNSDGDVQEVWFPPQMRQVTVSYDDSEGQWRVRHQPMRHMKGWDSSDKVYSYYDTKGEATEAAKQHAITYGFDKVVVKKKNGETYETWTNRYLIGPEMR